MEEERTLDDVLNDPDYSKETKEKLKEVEGLLTYEVLTEHLFESIPLLFPIKGPDEKTTPEFAAACDANMRLFRQYESRSEISEADWHEMINCYGIAMTHGDQQRSLANTIWPMMLYTLYLKDPGIRSMWPDLLPEGIAITLGGRDAIEVDQTMQRQIMMVAQTDELRFLASHYAIVRYLLGLSEEDVSREEMHMAGIDILGWELEKGNTYSHALVNFLLENTRNLLS